MTSFSDQYLIAHLNDSANLCSVFADAEKRNRVGNIIKIIFMKKLIILFSLASIFNCVHAQVTNWTFKTSSGGGGTTPSGICLDNLGNTYATGGFFGAVSFGGTVLSGDDLWIVKLDPSGSVIWAIQEGGTGDDDGYSIAIDPTQTYLYVTGKYQGTGTFDGTPGGSTVNLAPYGSSGDDIFLAKYNASNGNLIWAIRAGGGGMDQGFGVAVKSTGDVIITGHAWSGGGNVTFGSINLNATNLDIMYVARASSAGTWLNAIAGGVGASGIYSSGRGIAVDASNNIYVTGSSSTGAAWGTFTPTGSIGAYVAKANSNASAWTGAWAVTGGNSSGSSITNIGNSIYFTGSFAGTSTFGSTALVSNSGSNDVFVAKMSTSGVWNWAIRAGSAYSDYGTGIATNGSELFVTGYYGFGSPPGTNATFGATTLTTVNQDEVFLAKINSFGTVTCAVRGYGQMANEAYAIGARGKDLAIGGSFNTPGPDNPFIIGSTSQVSTFGAFEAFITRYEGVSVSPVNPKICPQSSVTLTATSGGGNYTWSPTTFLTPATGSPVVSTPTSAITYTVTSTTPFGCSSAASTNVSFLAGCIANAGPDKSLCCFTSPVMIGTPTQSNCIYNWTPTTGLSSSTIAQPLCSLTGTYIVACTSSVGCITYDSVTVNSGTNCCRIGTEDSDPEIIVGSGVISVTNNEANPIREIVIYDLTGKLIIRNGMKQWQAITDISSLSRGIYFIRIMLDDNSITTEKFFVE
jgi:hypothetical protein